MSIKFIYGTAVFVLAINVFVVAEHTKVINLDENNWRSVLENEWMIELAHKQQIIDLLYKNDLNLSADIVHPALFISYAPWCPACKNLSPAWERLAEWSNDLNIKTAKIDVTTSPALSGRFLVTALPTIFHVINGEFRQYRGARDAESLMAFVEDQKWKEIEPVSSWKDPDSIQMAIVSYFFKLSHYLKEVNNVMLIDYGMPPWLTYVLFAIVTILMGALLGLVLVSIIDLIFPPVSMNSRKSFTQAQAKSAADEDARDEIEDDATEATATSGAIPADDDDNSPSTSEEERVSGSDSDSNDEEDDPKQIDAKKSPKSSPSEVRKRKPRKAD